MTEHADALLTAVTATAQAVFAAAACSIAVLDQSGQVLEFRAASGAGADDVVGLRLPSNKGIAGWAVMSGQTLAVGDVAADARFDREAAAQTGYTPQAILAAPLVHDGEAIGVLEVLDPGATSAEGERGLELLGRFADQAALVVAMSTTAGGVSRPPAEEALLEAALEYARSRQQSA